MQRQTCVEVLHINITGCMSSVYLHVCSVRPWSALSESFFSPSWRNVLFIYPLFHKRFLFWLLWLTSSCSHVFTFQSQNCWLLPKTRTKTLSLGLKTSQNAHQSHTRITGGGQTGFRIMCHAWRAGVWTSTHFHSNEKLQQKQNKTQNRNMYERHF